MKAVTDKVEEKNKGVSLRGKFGMKSITGLNSGVVILVLLGFFFAGSTAGATSSMPLEFKSHLTKHTYLIGEPILMRFSLTNKTEQTMKVAEPLSLVGFVKILVTTKEGKQVDAPKLVWDIRLPPKDYGLEIGPGQTLERNWSLNKSYPFGLKPGFYSVHCIYDTVTYAAQCPGIWHGKIEAAGLEFEVTAPTGTEKEALVLFEKGRNIVVRARRADLPEARKILSELIKKFPDSVYVPYSSYLIAKSYFIMQADKTQHFAEATPKYQDFLKKFGEYPYYSDRVKTTELPASLSKTGRYEDARKILDKVPEGYFKQYTTENIERAAAKVEPGQVKPVVRWPLLLAAVAGIIAVSLLLLLKKSAASRSKSRAT